MKKQRLFEMQILWHKESRCPRADSAVFLFEFLFLIK